MKPLTKDHPIAAEILAVWDVMEGESHRGCVLAGAALIEWQMGNLLKAAFLSRHASDAGDIEKQIDVMLSPLNEKSVLGAAAPRARMCRLLGLISEETYRVLKDFLVFRNEHFAHARREVQLTDPKIKSRLDKLVELTPKRHRDIFKRSVDKDERGRFISVVAVLYMSLDHGYLEDQTGPQPSSS